MSRYAGMDVAACEAVLRRRTRLINLESLVVALAFVANFFLGWVKIPLWIVLLVIFASGIVAGARCRLARAELVNADDRACEEDELREKLGLW